MFGDFGDLGLGLFEEETSPPPSQAPVEAPPQQETGNPGKKTGEKTKRQGNKCPFLPPTKERVYGPFEEFSVADSFLHDGGADCHGRTYAKVDGWTRDKTYDLKNADMRRIWLFRCAYRRLTGCLAKARIFQDNENKFWVQVHHLPHENKEGGGACGKAT